MQRVGFRIINSEGIDLPCFRKHSDEMIPRVSWQFNGEKNWVDIDEINPMDKRKLEYFTWK